MVADYRSLGKINGMTIKKINNLRIFQLLYWEKELTLTEIRNKLELSSPTVIQGVQAFKKLEIFKDGHIESSSGGRKPTNVAFNYQFAISIGVEVRKNRYRIVVVELDGNVLKRVSIAIPFVNTEEYWKRMNDEIGLLIDEYLDDRYVLGIGIAFPGEVSFRKKIIERAMVLGLHNVSLDDVKKHFDYDVYIENGASTAGFGALWFNKKISDAVYVILTDDGVAGTIIMNNQIYRGHGKAGAFGHMSFDPNGKPCFCGSRGCWSTYGALNNLSSLTGGNLEDFFRKISENDEKCQKALDEYLYHLAKALSYLILSFDMDIVIGGELSKHLLPYMPRIKELIKTHPSLKDEIPNILLDDAEKNSMAVGAAMIYVSKMLNGHIVDYINENEGE